VENPESKEKKPVETKKTLSKEEKEKIEQLYLKFTTLKFNHIREGAKPIGKEKEKELENLEKEVNKLKGKTAKLNKTISAGIGVQLKTVKGAICPQHLIDDFIKEFKSNHPKNGKEYASNLMSKHFE